MPVRHAQEWGTITLAKACSSGGGVVTTGLASATQKRGATVVTPLLIYVRRKPQPRRPSQSRRSRRSFRWMRFTWFWSADTSVRLRPPRR